PIDDGLQVLLSLLYGQATKAIVGAKLEHEDIDGLSQDPIDTRQATGRGFTAYSGIDHFHILALLFQGLTDQRGEGGFRIDAVSGGETVTVKYDHYRGMGRPHEEPTGERKSHEIFHIFLRNNNHA